FPGCTRWRAEDQSRGMPAARRGDVAIARVKYHRRGSNRVDDKSLVTNASTGAQDAKALSSTAAPGPTRIRSLNVLRGGGPLGRLTTHSQLFAFPSLARWNPTLYGTFEAC